MRVVLIGERIRRVNRARRWLALPCRAPLPRRRRIFRPEPERAE